MKSIFCFALLLVLLTSIIAAPVDNKDSPKEAQSAFLPAFDEIVVESSLTVRRKTDAGRQGRSKNVTEAAPATITEKKRDKRQFSGFSGFSGNSGKIADPNFSHSVSDAHAQSNSVQGPFGGFGSSAAQGQTQAFNIGPNGISASAGLSGSQQYRLPNGQQIDVTFGNSGSSTNGNSAKTATSLVTITNPNGNH